MEKNSEIYTLKGFVIMMVYYILIIYFNYIISNTNLFLNNKHFNLTKKFATNTLPKLYFCETLPFLYIDKDLKQ